MPMTFTDAMVKTRAVYYGIDPNSPNLRELVAKATEDTFQDYVEAWEIRTGRPWNSMTRTEAEKLTKRHPELSGNPAILSKLYGV